MTVRVVVDDVRLEMVNDTVPHKVFAFEKCAAPRIANGNILRVVGTFGVLVMSSWRDCVNWPAVGHAQTQGNLTSNILTNPDGGCFSEPSCA